MKQQGFTLIELIVVIVILGILAATAMPKFVGLSGDARAASVKAAVASLSSAAAMAHGKMLAINAASNVSGMVYEGATTVTLVNGYPDSLTVADLLSLDSTAYTSAASGTAAVKFDVAGGTADTCTAVYNESVAGAAPVVSAITSGC